MVRIRDPGGDCEEWTGPWSDDDIKDLPDDVKERYNIVNKCDGEFFMSFEDMLERFESITVCHVMNDHYASLEHNEESFEDSVSLDSSALF